MTQPEALRLAERIDGWYYQNDMNIKDVMKAADELRRLHHNNQVLMDALWKACGDDEEVVNGIIASQRELK